MEENNSTYLELALKIRDIPFKRGKVASVISILIPFKDSDAYSISSKCRITGLSAGGVLMMWDRRALENINPPSSKFKPFQQRTCGLRQLGSRIGFIFCGIDIPSQVPPVLFLPRS